MLYQRYSTPACAAAQSAVTSNSGAGSRVFAWQHRAQMACTPKELREILRIAGPNLHVDQQLLQPTPSEQQEMAAVRIKRRLHEVLSKAAAKANPRRAARVIVVCAVSHFRCRLIAGAAAHCRPGAKQLHFHFFQTPTAFSSDPEGCVGGVSIASSLSFLPKVAQPHCRRAVQETHIPSQLVFKSVGYKAIPLGGVAFEDNRGVIPNRHAPAVCCALKHAAAIDSLSCAL